MDGLTGRRHFLGGMMAAAAPRGGMRINAAEAGAVGDGATLNTAALQKAIDACAARGGGTVLLPAGRFLTGTIELKSNVTLHLEPGSVLLGSAKLSDYPSRIPAFRSYTDSYTEKSLIYAERAHDIAITGQGRMDGQGKAFSGPYKVRPYMIRVIECRNVTVTDVTIEDSPMWVQHFLACENVAIRGIRVHSRVNHNNDGIDIDCCDRVTISDCEIFSGDDAIVIKSTADRATRNVTVTNCVLSTNCNALKLGTESNGGFFNIAISNCTVYDTKLAGIALEMVDGGKLERVSVSNIVMDGVGAPIFLRLGNRARPFTENGPTPGMGQFRDVILSDIQAVNCGPAVCAIAGIPGHCIEDLTLSNIRLRFVGGGAEKLAAREVPEEIAKYPEFRMFGDLPAFGFYCRHVRGLRMEGIELSTAKGDARPAVVFEDVEKALVQGFRTTKPLSAFLRVRSGGGISLMGNDFTGVAKPFEGPGIWETANRLR